MRSHRTKHVYICIENTKKKATRVRGIAQCRVLTQHMWVPGFDAQHCKIKRKRKKGRKEGRKEGGRRMREGGKRRREGGKKERKERERERGREKKEESKSH
jgi:hypothetical protein